MKFPPRCINCAAGAFETIRIERLFISDDGEGHETFELASVYAPLCANCAATHQRELKSVPFLDRLWPALKTEAVIPTTIAAITGLFFLKEWLLSGAVILGFVVLFFGLIAFFSGRVIATRMRRFGLPAATSVSECFTFTQDRRKMFEPSRRRFRFRSSEFAEAFVELNRSRLWDPRSELAARAATKRAIVYGILIGIALIVVGFSLWSEYFR